MSVDLDRLRAALNSERPVRAALAALLAFHALRPGELRSLQLTDIIDGRLRIGGLVIALAADVRTRLAAWLDERHRRWLRTANPHLFINIDTAVLTTSVSAFWANATLGNSAQTLVEDRVLDEATATGDVRRICDLFDITVETALRYVRLHDA
ncbi:hypothetical protein [Nonomuraea jabiensis]|uniref:hypothetical protein n=1 Tax=Nonomuraea jabiensis TaxID=882448 RepID=UPI0036AE652B